MGRFVKLTERGRSRGGGGGGEGGGGRRKIEEILRNGNTTGIAGSRRCTLRV